MAAARSMRLVSAILGEGYTAENLHECGTVDCSLVSLNGYSYLVHYPLIVDWLGSAVPQPNLQNQIHLQISHPALRLLIDIIYQRRIQAYAVKESLLELIDYSLVCGWYQFADDLIVSGFDDIEDEGLPRYWMYSRERQLQCEMLLRKKLGDVALAMCRENSRGCNDLLTIPIQALFDLIDNEEVYWPSGRACLEVIYAWCQRNPEAAIQHCRQLFKIVRFKSVAEMRQAKIEYQTFFLQLGMNETALVNAINTYSSLQPLVPRSIFVFMGGWIQRKTSEKSYFFDVSVNNWAPIPKLDLPEKLSYFKCQMVNDKLYIVGGFSDGNFRSSVWRFDFYSLKWEPCAALNETKGYFATTSMNNFIYVLGGSDSRLRLASFDRLDTVTNTWTSLPPLSAGRSDAAALTYKNRIWIFGGFDGSRTLSLVEAYDPTTGQWTDMPSMEQPRSGHCAVLFQNKIFVVGGFQHGRSTDTVEYYDNGHWKSAPSMSVPRSNFDAVVYDGCIYVMGGHVSEESISHCEKFDGHQWTTIHCLPKSIAAGAAIFIDKPPHVSKLLSREA